MFSKETTALLEENPALKKEIDQLTLEVRKAVYLEEQNDQLLQVLERRDQTIRAQQSQLNELLKRLYGRRSEKLDPNQIVFDEVLLTAEQSVAAEEPLITEEVKEEIVREHIRRNHPGRRPLPEHLKRIEHYLDIEESDKVTAEGKERPLIGFDITERLDYQPCTMVVHRYIRPKYGANDEIEGAGVKQRIKRKFKLH